MGDLMFNRGLTGKWMYNYRRTIFRSNITLFLSPFHLVWLQAAVASQANQLNVNFCVRFQAVSFGLNSIRACALCIKRQRVETPC